MSYLWSLSALILIILLFGSILELGIQQGILGIIVLTPVLIYLDKYNPYEIERKK